MFVPRVALRPRTIVSARAVAITLLPCRSFRRERSGRSALGGTINRRASVESARAGNRRLGSAGSSKRSENGSEHPRSLEHPPSD